MESPTHPETETAEPGPRAFASLGEGARLGQMAGVVPDHSAPWPWPQALAPTPPRSWPSLCCSRPRVTRHPGHIPENCLVEGALRVGGGQVQPPQAAPGTLGVGFTGHSGTKPRAQALGPPSLQLQPHEPSRPICHQSFVPAVPRTGAAQPMTAHTSAHEGPRDSPHRADSGPPAPQTETPRGPERVQ